MVKLLFYLNLNTELSFTQSPQCETLVGREKMSTVIPNGDRNPELYLERPD